MSKVADLLNQQLPYGPAPEDAKAATEWLEKHNRSFGSYINGEWVKSKQTFASINPADATELAQISQATEVQINQAVESAEEALIIWQAQTPQKRAEYLYAIARQIQKHSRLFAVLETLDNGKPIRETRDIDIPLVARHFYYHAGFAKILDQEFPGYQPVGVCGQIIPWNFPLLMMAWKIAPALAAGNTIILKPAEFTSLTALLFADICDNIGLPAGVINIVTGDGEVGKTIVEHPGIKKIAFTGSTEVGRIIRKATADTDKKLSLELGGKSPFIVFDDADLDSAVEGLVDAIWFNQGQVCCAGSRLLVQESIAEKLYAKIRLRMATLRVGNPLDKVVDLGAIVDRTQLERITDLVNQGVEEGATKYQAPCDLPQAGFYFPPTLLTDVEPSSTVVQEEIFGPVLVAMTFRTPAEAVALANNTPYGLAGSIWTQNLDIAHDIAAQVKAGAIWINCTNQFDASAGFGGYRESGFGREGGREGMLEYLKPILPKLKATPKVFSPKPTTTDRTHKLYIGGKQSRPDGGYSFEAHGHEFALANRKDLRNAVEAAASAQPAWEKTTAFLKSQILYYIAENLQAAEDQFLNAGMSEQEFQDSIGLLFHYAAVADKYDGQVHQAPLRALVYTRNEAIGVCAGFAPQSHPLLGLIAVTAPLIAMGNAVVAIPSAQNPLPAVEFMRILEASDVPAGVFNILTAPHADLEKTVADHLGIDAVWHFSGEPGAHTIQSLSAGNLKQTWCVSDPIDFTHPHPEFLRRATQVKNIWTPYGA
jgi:aldehyde dehydrogenase (NAD+)